MAFKIFFSNIGYARDIDGSLRAHIAGFSRHLYCSLPIQEQVIHQISDIISEEQPDICCFVEIDSGSFMSSNYDQMKALSGEIYPHSDISNKYGQALHRFLPFHSSKSNGFMARTDMAFEKRYFSHGTKKLFYILDLPEDIKLIFAHFSLRYKTRKKQLKEMHDIIMAMDNEVIIMADFNILRGFSELDFLMHGQDLCLLNKEDEHTFVFHRRKNVLDLCMCSESLKDRIDLKIIPQCYSDHAALLASVQA